MFKLSRSILFVCAFLPLANQAFAKDERSIKDLSKALAGLSSDVDPKEAELVAVTAHTTARKLARDYHVVLNPEFRPSWSTSAPENVVGAAIGHRISARN